MGELVIQNVNVVLPDQVLENGSVRLQDQLIQEVSRKPLAGAREPRRPHSGRPGRFPAARADRHSLGQY